MKLYTVNKPFRRSCAFKVHGRTDRRTDGQGDSYIPPKTLFAGGMKRIKGYKERGMIRLQNVDKGKSNKYILNVWIQHFAGQ
jgi:hypothetical protein